MKITWKLLAFVLLVSAVLLMLANRGKQHDGAPAATELTPTTKAGDTRKSTIPAERADPVAAERSSNAGNRVGKFRWDIELEEAHRTAVLGSIEAVVADVESRRKPDFYPIPVPLPIGTLGNAKVGFEPSHPDWSLEEEVLTNRWARRGNVGEPTREEAAWLVKSQVNAVVAWPSCGYETNDYYVISSRHRSVANPQHDIGDIFHFGYAVRKTDGLMYAWKLPSAYRKKLLETRGNLDLELEGARRAEWGVKERAQAGERREQAMEARQKENGE